MYKDSYSSLNVSCPFCQGQLSVSPNQAGAATTCPRCGGRFQIPLPTAQAAVGSNQSFGGSQSYEVQQFANKKIAAGICGILVGGFGVHKFILGFNGAGAIMLSVWLVGFITGMCLVIPILASMAMGIIGLVEGIIYLTKTDEEFYQTYAIERKEWF